MRFIGICAGIVLTTGVFSQIRGEYVESAGSKHSWRVSAENCLIWDGNPWIPLGPIVASQDYGKLGLAVGHGISSALMGYRMDQPLQPIVDAAELAKVTYCLEPEASAPLCTGNYIMPQSYRVAGIKGPVDLKLRLPAADSAFWTLVDAETGTAEMSGRARVEEGQISFSVKPKRTGEYVVLLFPHSRQGNLIDYWEGYDTWRDQMLAKLRAAKLGPGLRGIVDPLGRVDKWYDFNRRFVPESALFRLEFERYLKRTYGTVDKLSQAWRMDRDPPSFREAAKLVPLYAEGRGLQMLWNPATDLLLPSGKGSKYWDDFEAYLKSVAAERAGNLARAIHRVVDVPVLFTWKNWSIVSQGKTAAGDGIGVQAIGVGAKVADFWGAPAVGASLTWDSAPWLVATDVAVDRAGTAFGADQDPSADIATLASLGIKGFFVRVGLETPTMAKLAAAKVPPYDQKAKTLEFPESATTPANVMQLPSGVWWVPSPRVGTRMDYGESFEAYRINTGAGTMVALWSLKGAQDVFLRFANPETVRVATWDRQPVTPKLKKDGMSLVIGELPTLFLSADDLPVPDAVYRQTDDAIKEYFKLDSAMGVDFSDLKLDVDMARDGFARNPGNAFAILRNVYQKIVSRIGKYLWIEAENPSSTTFGFSASSAAASDGKYLAVDTPFEPLDGAYKASYSINVPDNTTLRLLIAGSLPEEGTLHFEVSIGTSPPIPVNSEPLSLYGGSFAWYDAGTVALSKGRTTLTIAVRGAPGAYYQASLDAILLTAGAFTPSGVRRPTVPYPGK